MCVSQSNIEASSFSSSAKRIFLEFQDEKSRLYQPSLVKLLGRKVGVGQNPPATGSKSKPKRKAKAKGKAGGKRTALLEQLKLLGEGGSPRPRRMGRTMTRRRRTWTELRPDCRAPPLLALRGSCRLVQ